MQRPRTARFGPESSVPEIEKELEKNPAQTKLLGEKEKVAEIQKEINNLRERVSGIDAEIEKIRGGISVQLKALEEFGSAALKSEVVLSE